MSEAKKELVKIVIPINKDRKFGLGVIDNNKRVIVSTIEPDSIAAEYLKVNDYIVSINDIQVQDKSHCKDIIVNADDEEEEFEFVIERLSINEEVEKGKAKEMENLDKEKEKLAVEKVNLEKEKVKFKKEKAKLEKEKSDKEKEKSDKEKEKEKEKPKEPETIEISEFDFQTPPKEQTKNVQTGKVAADGFQLFFMEDDTFGNPLEGLTFPAPPDVRAILRKRIPEILADYQKVESAPSSKQIAVRTKTPGSGLQIENETHEHAIGSDVPSTKNLAKVKTKKKP